MSYCKISVNPEKSEYKKVSRFEFESTEEFVSFRDGLEEEEQEESTIVLGNLYLWLMRDTCEECGMDISFAQFVVMSRLVREPNENWNFLNDPEIVGLRWMPEEWLIYINDLIAESNAGFKYFSGDHYFGTNFSDENKRLVSFCTECGSEHLYESFHSREGDPYNFEHLFINILLPEALEIDGGGSWYSELNSILLSSDQVVDPSLLEYDMHYRIDRKNDLGLE